MNDELQQRLHRLSQNAIRGVNHDLGKEGQPFMVLHGVSEDNAEALALRKQWEDRCAAQITAGTHTLNEMVDWLSAMYDMEPVDMDPTDFHLKIYASNLEGRYADEAGEENTPALDTMTEDEIMALSDEELAELMAESYRSVMENRPASPFDIDVEALDWSIKVYRFPQTEKNAHFYETYLKQERADAERMRRSNPAQAAETLLDFEKNLREACIMLYTEETTGDWELQSPLDHNKLFCQIHRYTGISQPDIEARNMKFLSYITTEGFAGHLPTFEEFKKEMGVD